jgi:hypothetical protein
MAKKYYDDEAIEKSRHIDSKGYPKSDKPTHKSAREILTNVQDTRIEVDTALSSLAELVREDVKDDFARPVGKAQSDYTRGWNSALEHIAQKLEGEEMSREIKFRAWDFEKMCYGIDLTNGDGGYYSSVDLCPQHTDSKIPIVMQFSGLLDKNGKEVYEGDIVKVLDDDGDEISEDTIVYNAPSFEFMPDNSLAIDGRIVEVIGNIYENPELLRSPK